MSQPIKWIGANTSCDDEALSTITLVLTGSQLGLNPNEISKEPKRLCVFIIARVHACDKETVDDEASVRMSTMDKDTVVNEASVRKSCQIDEETVDDEASVRMSTMDKDTVVNEASVRKSRQTDEETVDDEASVRVYMIWTRIRQSTKHPFASLGKQEVNPYEEVHFECNLLYYGAWNLQGRFHYLRSPETPLEFPCQLVGQCSCSSVAPTHT